MAFVNIILHKISQPANVSTLLNVSIKEWNVSVTNASIKQLPYAKMTPKIINRSC